MFDNVDFWVEKGNMSGGKTFDILPFLSEIIERQSDKTGYSCNGKSKNYSVSVYENGISLKGSLCKNYFGDNLHTLQRKDVQFAIEQLSDTLHIDLLTAKVTRLDVSTIIATNRPPCDYYSFLGQKAYFERLQSTPNTLYYNNHQRQIIFYDKSKEATAKNVVIPEILQGQNLLRYEYRYLKRLDKQFNTHLTAGKLYETEFYLAVIQNWYNEFKTIDKIRNTNSMTRNITKPKEAETALFARLLQQAGHSAINDFLAELKASNTFNDKKYYSRLKANLNKILSTPKGEQNDLMKELETEIFNIAKYAR